MRSAGLLPYRIERRLEVLIAHPGGPYFTRKDAGWWSLVKGMVREGEPDREAAAREFEEETGWKVPPIPWIPLGTTTLKSRKVVVAWAIEHSFDLARFEPGTFTLHGRTYPEIDRVGWFPTEDARAMLGPAQGEFVDRLEAHIGLNGGQKE
jgi:predicted NUDIX family NTP pyrophosphohydrolase